MRFLGALSALLIAVGLAALAAPATAESEAYLSGVTQVAASGAGGTTCARTAGGFVRCWGQNDVGQVGNGNTEDQRLSVSVLRADGSPLRNVRQVAVGERHACALLTNGTVRCWGDDGAGQLGDTYEINSGEFVTVNVGGVGPLSEVTQITAGADHTCALMSNGRVRCWGFNGSGQLGIGSTWLVAGFAEVVRTSGGTALRNVAQISAGSSHTCAVTTAGQARCWGWNGHGQIGDDGGPYRWHPSAVRNMTFDGNLTGVRRVAAGGYSTCALLTSGQLRCWGNNDEGQLGTNDTNTSEIPRAVVSTTGSGRLRDVTQVSVGELHACARLERGGVRCWGSDNHLQLSNGAGGDAVRPAPVLAMGGSPLIGIAAVTSGKDWTCARQSSGQAVCWGENSRGQLGDGSMVDQPSPLRVQTPL